MTGALEAMDGWKSRPCSSVLLRGVSLVTAVSQPEIDHRLLASSSYRYRYGVVLQQAEEI